MTNRIVSANGSIARMSAARYRFRKKPSQPPEIPMTNGIGEAQYARNPIQATGSFDSPGKIRRDVKESKAAAINPRT